MFDHSGIAYLRAALARDDAGAIANQIWESFAARGVRRDDAATWPTDGFQIKLQKLRRSGVFKAFDNDVVRAAITDVLGEGWYELDPWGAPLVTFPTPGDWKLPHHSWHSDHPAVGDPDRPAILRLFGFVSDVAPQGGGTLVIEGSHELIRRMVAASPGHNAGSSRDVRKQLYKRYPWFNDPSFEPVELDGVTVRVRELTGEAGDVALMLPWTLHNIAMNSTAQPRFMVTHTAFAKGAHAPSA